MSRNDITIKESGGRNFVPIDRWVTASGQVALIDAGEPAKTNDDEGEAILLEDADLTLGTDKLMTGIGANDSTDTVAASGYSDQYVPLPDIKCEIKAMTSTTADLQSEIDALLGHMVVIDFTTPVFTMDAGASTSASNAFVIVGGDPNRATIHFRIRGDASLLGRGTV